MNVEAGLAHTNRLVQLLNDRRTNKEWQLELDKEFLPSVFNHNHAQPCFLGPDGFRHFGFKLPESGDKIAATTPSQELDYIIEWVAGGVILHPNGQSLYVFSPGDMISLKLFGKTEVQWQGGWSKEPDTELYSKGGVVNFGRPNDVMLPPLVARALDLYLSTSVFRNPKLAGRVPSVAIMRHSSLTNPEDPSELLLNVFSDDFPLESGFTFKNFLDWIGYILPRHLRLRVLGMSSSAVDQSLFTPLKTIVEEAGLKPAPIGQ